MKRPVSLLRFCLLVLLLVFVYCRPAAATLSCSAYPGNSIEFGTFGVLGGGVVDTTGTVTYGCNTDQAAAVQVLMCIGAGPDPTTSGYDPRHLPLESTAATSALAFNLYQDAARSLILGNVNSVGSYAPLAVTASISNYYQDGNVSVYGRIKTAGQASAASGNYGYAWPFTLSYMAYQPGANCSSPQLVVGTTWTLQTEATVQSQCQINSASTMNFGAIYGLLNQNVDSTSTVNVTCSAALPYTVSLDNGQHASGTTRRMQGTGGYIQYGLYSNTLRTTNWNSTTTVAGTGNGLAQALTVYGRVPPQTLSGNGQFSDTIVVTVTY